MPNHLRARRLKEPTVRRPLIRLPAVNTHGGNAWLRRSWLIGHKPNRASLSIFCSDSDLLATSTPAELTRRLRRMPTKLLRVLSFLGKAAGLALTIAGPLSGTPIGLTVFAAASLLKDAVNHFGDLADDGKPNDSFKP